MGDKALPCRPGGALGEQRAGREGLGWPRHPTHIPSRQPCSKSLGAALITGGTELLLGSSDPF